MKCALSPDEGPTGIWNLFTQFAADFYDSRTARGFSGDDIDAVTVPEYLAAIREWFTRQAPLQS